MTMETQKNSYSDLYLMLSPIYDTLHLRRCNLGDKGFEEFALENVQRAHDQALFPNNWMFHYHFSEEQIPRIKSLDGMHRRDFFQKLRPALLEEGITPLHILPLDRALYLHIHCKPLLASCRDIPTLALSDLFARDGNPDFEPCTAAVPGIYSRKNLSGSSFIYPYTKRSPAAGRLHAEHRRQLLLTANAGDRDHHIQTPGF